MTKSFMRSASIIALSVMASGLGVSAAAAQKAQATQTTVNKQTTEQKGDSNSIEIDQVKGAREDAGIFQTGNSNVAKITQSGTGDSAYSQSNGNGNTVTMTFATGATNNASEVYQSADSNSATSTISGTDQKSVIIQSGNSNTALTKLSGNGGTGSDANATIEQRSVFNDATITQAGTQSGSAKIIQGVTTASATRGSKYNVAYTTSTAAPVTKKSTGDVGAFNVATVSQDSNASTGVANIYQGADFNEAHATQNGGNQFVEIRQDSATGAEMFGNNLAEVTQDAGGIGASAFVLQNGQSNQVYLTQSALNVSADLAQYGNKNVLTLTQTVAGSTAKLTQTGNSNTLTMKQ